MYTWWEGVVSYAEHRWCDGDGESGALFACNLKTSEFLYEAIHLHRQAQLLDASISIKPDTNFAASFVLVLLKLKQVILTIFFRSHLQR